MQEEVRVLRRRLNMKILALVNIFARFYSMTGEMVMIAELVGGKSAKTLLHA